MSPWGPLGGTRGGTPGGIPRGIPGVLLSITMGAKAHFLSAQAGPRTPRKLSRTARPTSRSRWITRRTRQRMQGTQPCTGREQTPFSAPRQGGDPPRAVGRPLPSPSNASAPPQQRPSSTPATPRSTPPPEPTNLVLSYSCRGSIVSRGVLVESWVSGLGGGLRVAWALFRRCWGVVEAWRGAGADAHLVDRDAGCKRPLF